MTQPVSVGDDGRNTITDENEGPLLTSIRRMVEKWQADTRSMIEERDLRWRQARVLAQPAYAPVTNSGTIDASGNLVIDLDGPQKGRRWVVRMVTVSDAGSFWASMGTAKITLCTGTKNGNTVLPNQVRWPMASGPNSATFSADQMWVVPRDRVLVSVTGGTPAQNVQATIWIQDFNALVALPGENV